MTVKPENLTATEYAIQLVGPGELRLNSSKPVPVPGDYDILVQVEAVGLCFSDLKLLKQFDQHPRKSEIIAGIDADIVNRHPSYAPGSKPTVPGHEVTCRVIAVGSLVRQYQVGDRCLVQTDYRALRTASSNAAFGYNFEGGLQEYVMMDERVITDPETGEGFLLPVPEDLGASTVALVEPWACVEDSYVTSERNHLLPGGKLLVVVDLEAATGVYEMIEEYPSAAITIIDPGAILSGLEGTPAQLTDLVDEHYDDIIYFGTSALTIELLNDKLAAGGIINIVTGGYQIPRPVSVGVGRVHYGSTRWIGTLTGDARESYNHIPATGELRPGDRMAVIGAGGPMGQMHVLRALACGLEDVHVTAVDFDDSRLQALQAKADAATVPLTLHNPQTAPLVDEFSYWALMAPIGQLVADAVQHSTTGSLINIFAGIPSATRQELNLNHYITCHCYMFGTSGSTTEDMKIVLEKINNGRLDTDASVDAISGMAGAIAGLQAVEQRTLAGKIVVYPMLHDVGLIPLHDLATSYPTVAALLDHGKWNAAAEAELLRVATPKDS